MRIGYSGTHTTFNANQPMRDYSIEHYSIETAGNFLSALSHVLGSAKDTTGAYQIFGIRYAQYVKGEFNITHHQIFDPENSFVYHLDVGIGVPYGNGDEIPFEKRFYSGGANSVRGWSESTLGPGVYQRITSLPRDFNQVGDIKLDMNMEYRTKMFWLLEGALFLDAGNVWTIKNYDTQPGGVFQFNTFASQIAIAYGLGLRFDFSFFIARVDLGFKLYNPVLDRRDQWRVNPGIDDMALHFAIGYPF
jgi:outer membrane protein assembly factor BamA